MRFLLIFSLCALACSAYAQDMNQTRALYLEAEKAAQSGNTSRYRELAQSLSDYPLAPYAEALFLQRHLSIKHKSRINGFLSLYGDAPFTTKLRSKWLNYLAKRKYRQEFLSQYQDIGDAKLACFNLEWQLAAGAPEQDIFPQVDRLWLAPKSQPRACDPLFKKWKLAGYQTPDKALERLVLAAKARNYSLLPYLKTLLSSGDKHLASMWQAVVSRPSRVTKRNFFLLHNQDEKDVFLYALNRMVYAKPEKTLKFWLKKKDKFDITSNEAAQLEKKLALSFAISDHKDGLEWLTKVPDDKVDESVKQWRLAYTLAKQNWQQTLNVVSDLPEQMQTDLSVVYWKARALEQLGNKNWAQQSFQELAERRDYYGFLAANKLGKTPKLRHEPLIVSDIDIARIKRLGIMQRAYELFKLNRTNDARREWNVLLQYLNDDEKLAAAKMAYDWGWYDRPIFMLAELGYLNDVQLRFPLAYKSLLSNAAQQNQLDPALIFAIARRESSFMHDAYSSAGAAGLMQLKPSTASYVAKSKVKRGQLFRPEKNVNLGSNYLSYLLEKTNGNVILTTAAYNAGFGRVKRWLPETQMPADAWIETIPYKETRNYVKAVMAYSKVYQQLLALNTDAFGDVTDQQIAPSL